MKKYLKAIAIVLILGIAAMMLPGSSIFADDEVQKYSVSLICTSISDNSISVYVKNDLVLMSIGDVARITRCEVSEENGVYTLRHGNGMRSIELNLFSQTLVENEEQYSINLVQYADTLLVPAFSMLTYLGADCSFDSDNSSLCIYMPMKTFWEVLSFTQENIMNPQVKEETWKKVSIVGSLIVDMMAPLSGRSVWEILFLGGADESSAVYAALEADITKYPSVDSNLQERATKLNDIAKTLGIAKKFQDAQFDLTSLYEDELFRQAYKAIFSLKKTDQAECLNAFQTALQQQADFKKASAEYGDALSVALFILDTFTTTYDRLNIERTAADALIETFSKETLDAAGDPDLDETYLDSLQNVSDTLESDDRTIAHTFMEKSAELVADTFGSYIEKKLPASVFLSIELAGLVIEVLGRSPIGKFTPFAEIPRSEADLKAILSADLYLQTVLVFNGLVEKAASAKYHDADTLQKFYYSYLLLLRFSLVHYESLIECAETEMFEPKNKSALEQKADAIASTIDRLNCCSPDPIPVFGVTNNFAPAYESEMVEYLRANTSEQIQISGSGSFLDSFSIYDNPVDFEINAISSMNGLNIEMTFIDPLYYDGPQITISINETDVAFTYAREESGAVVAFTAEALISIVGQEPYSDLVNVMLVDGETDLIEVWFPDADWEINALYSGYITIADKDDPINTAQMYSSYAILMSVNMETGWAEFDYFDRLQGEDAIKWLMEDRGYTRAEAETAFEQAEPPNYIYKNVNPQLRTINLNKIEILFFPIDNTKSYYLDYNPVQTNAADFLEFCRNNPDLDGQDVFYVTVDENGKPIRIEQIFVS